MKIVKSLIFAFCFFYNFLPAYSAEEMLGADVEVVTRPALDELKSATFYQTKNGSVLYKIVNSTHFDTSTVGEIAFANQIIVKINNTDAIVSNTISLKHFGLDIDLSLQKLWGDYHLATANTNTPLTAGELVVALKKSSEKHLFNHFEPNFLGEFDDFQYGEDFSVQQWAFSNRDLGHVNSGSDYDIDSDIVDAKALARRTSANEIIVAVMDSGLRPALKSFENRLWVNVNEIKGNGIDDDQNGYIDDVHGYDFFANTSHLTDTRASAGGHGTAVSAIIAANPDASTYQYAGVADNARILTGIISTRIGNRWDLASLLEGISYASNNGAKVLNLSISTTVYSRSLDEIVQRFAIDFDGFVVASAGNAIPRQLPVDVLKTPTYPCILGSVYCVASSNRFDKLSSFSNFQTFNLPFNTVVQTAAPGERLRSINASGNINFVSGTSFAAPLVSGAVALLKGLRPQETNTQIWLRLQLGAEPVTELQSKVGTTRFRYWAGNRLNVYHSLLVQKSLLSSNRYCDQKDDSGYQRRTGWPYANSSDTGIDGNSLQTAFTICTKRQLLSIKEEDHEKHFVLKDSIDWNEKTHLGIQMIGQSWGNPRFNGTFYGQGHTIFGIDIDVNWPWGLFKELGASSSVSHLFIRGAKIKTKSNAGAVAVRSSGRLNFVEVEGEVVANGIAGGLVAFQNGGQIRKSYFEGKIRNSGGRAGGISGMMSNNSILIQSSVRAHIAANGAGGFSGYMGSGTKVEKSYSNIKIVGSRSGGMVGELECGATIENSMSAGHVAGIESAGIAHQQSNANVLNVLSLVKDLDDRGRVGAIYKKIDNLEASIGGSNNWYYVCTGDQTLPPPSIQSECIYHDEALRAPRDKCSPHLMRQLKVKSTYKNWDLLFTWSKYPSKPATLQNVPRSRGYYHPSL